MAGVPPECCLPSATDEECMVFSKKAFQHSGTQQLFNIYTEVSYLFWPNLNSCRTELLPPFEPVMGRHGTLSL